MRKPALRAFTLLEIIVSIAILGLLAALLIQNLTPIMTRVSKARCVSNMRSLHVGFSNYLNDHPYWPQMPEEVYASEHNYDGWWIDTMMPYTQTDRVWRCPVLLKADASLGSNPKRKIHYIPTHFDANPISPRRWSTQPWLIERGNAHGAGALIIFPDGAIREADSF